MRMKLALGTALVVVVIAKPALAQDSDGPQYSIAGSVQLDYLAVPTEDRGRDIALDAATVELSLKATVDFNEHISASVKVCYACHGFEAGMAFFDLRVADELNFRVGRFTPTFGAFPLRHDPANHRTSDKPLPYDMGRMLYASAWGGGVLLAPWVDNGLEINGTHFFGESARVDYALFAISGPKAGTDPADFDYILSRSPDSYYVDNNSEPTVGGRFGVTFDLGKTSTTLGGSGMVGRYDNERDVYFWIAGADLTLQVMSMFFRAEYLWRETEFEPGGDLAMRFKQGPRPDGSFDDTFRKDGFYGELEVPIGPVDAVLRADGLMRKGNVPITSPLSPDSTLFRYTTALAIRIISGVRIKASFEYYDFNDFDNEVALHLGVASAF